MKEGEFLRVSDLRIADDGRVLGRVSLNGGESGPFPSAHWDDFVLVVLSWWAADVVALLAGERSEAELLFMDGPYEAGLVQGSGSELVLSCYEQRLKGKEARSQLELSAETVRRQLCAAAREALDFARQRGIEDSDVTALARALERLDGFAPD